MEPRHWQAAPPSKKMQEEVGFTEATLFKVYEALRKSGLSEDQVRDGISEMQNAGILFRERVEVPKSTSTCR